MSGARPIVEPLTGTAFGVIADAHVHPGSGPVLPERVSEAFRGVAGIFALGDIGESAGFDALEALAPLMATRGADDPSDDPRSTAEYRLFEHRGRLIGAVFDAARHGLFRSNEPLDVVPDFTAALTNLFGRPVSVLLCAGTHRPAVAWRDGVLIVDPGSPTLWPTAARWRGCTSPWITSV